MDPGDQTPVCMPEDRIDRRLDIAEIRPMIVEPAVDLRHLVQAFFSGLQVPLSAGQELLEVKFDTILPSHLRQAVYLDTLSQTSFSKYQLCRQALGRTGG